VLAGLAVAFEAAVGIGVGARRSGEDQVDVRLERRQRARLQPAAVTPSTAWLASSARLRAARIWRASASRAVARLAIDVSLDVSLEE
jgi:hypothetical protein